MNDRTPHREPVLSSLQEYARGVAGGLMFSLPLLYTMEVWWSGFLSDPSALLACIGITFLLLLGYNRYGGIRRDFRFMDVVIDSVEEFGLGVLLATLVLYLLGRITPEMPFNEILGKIVIESVLVSIGVSVGTAELGFGSQVAEDGNQQENSDEPPAPSPEPPRVTKQIALSYCGAVLFAANVAPTEEIVIIAMESTSARLIALMVLSLAIGAIVLYFSSFYQSRHLYPAVGLVRGALMVTTTYAIALVASAMLLWFFKRFDGASLEMIVAQTVVLGFAGNLGASAGRLLIE